MINMDFKIRVVITAEWQPDQDGLEVMALHDFKDEYGRYPSGTWIRSPHLSAHQPYVEQDTLLWVKTAHLPISA